MTFLLGEASTEYFMWAGDDDLWHPDYIKTCIALLDEHEDAIVSFSRLHTIDENGELLLDLSNPSYSNNSAFKRIASFVKNPIDGFGYGSLLGGGQIETRLTITFTPLFAIIWQKGITLNPLKNPFFSNE